MGPLCHKKRVQNSICKQTLPLPNSNLSPTDRKSGSSRRGQQTPTQRGSGEDRTRKFRLLFSYFPGSQEEWEITTNNRSVQTEYVSGYSVIQNLDSQQGQTGDSTQRLGVLIRSNRCLSTCYHSPAVSEVSPFLSQGSDLSIQGSSVWPCDKSLCFHPFDGCHSNISTEEGNCTVSISGQKSGSSGNSERPTVYNRADYVPRTDNQRRKVRFGRPVSSSYQCFRDESNIASIKTMSPICLQFNSDDCHGQLFGSFIPEERRGHPFSISVHGSMGDTPVVQSERYKSSGETYPRIKSNILADQLSRLSKPISTEWSLDQTICNSILSMTGFPNIDLFATRLTRSCHSMCLLSQTKRL